MRKKAAVIGFILSAIVAVMALSLTVFEYIKYSHVDNTLWGLSAVTVVLFLINWLNYAKGRQESKNK